MHILVIPSFLPPYGGRFALDQACALAGAGHRVGVLHCQQLGATVLPRHYLTARVGRWEERPAPRVALFRTNMRGVPKCVRPNERRYVATIVSMYHQYVERHGRPDLIHAHCSQWAGVAAMRLSETEGVPYVVTEHLPSLILKAAYGETWQRHQWAQTLIKEALRRAGRVVAVADEYLADIDPLLGHDFRHTVISNIIDTSYYTYREREPLLGDDGRQRRPYRYVCLAIANGHFLHTKGYDTLLAAFTRLGGDSELHIAGRATDGRAMRRLIAQSGADRERVVIHGDLTAEGVRELLWHSDALVLSSRSEVQPLAVMEAMATGLPVAATEALPAVLRLDGHTAVAPRGDSAALADAMRRVREMKPSPDCAAHISRLASAATVAGKLTALFESVIKEHKEKGH